MHAVSTNQIADILHFNDKDIYQYSWNSKLCIPVNSKLNFESNRIKINDTHMEGTCAWLNLVQKFIEI